MAFLYGEDSHAVELAKATNCNMMLVGASVYEEMLAQPVKTGFERAVSYFMVQLKSQNRFGALKEKYAVKDECAGKRSGGAGDAADEGKMDIPDFVGTFIIV